MVSIFEIFIIFILPVLLWKFGLITVEYLWWILSGMVLSSTVIAVSERWSLQTLGIRTNNFAQGALPYLVFTTVGIVIILVLAKIMRRDVLSNWREDTHFIFGFLFISIFGKGLAALLFRTESPVSRLI